MSLLIIFSSFLVLPKTTKAATNSTINFQARILQTSGALVPDGDYNVEFKIYDSLNAGATAQGACSLDSSTDDCWWLETRTGVNVVRVANGYISVNLGSVTPFGANIPWDQDLYITMRVGGIGAPVWDSEMVNGGKRMKFNGAPYAFQAGGLKTTNGANSTTVNFTPPTGTNTITFGDGSGLVCLNDSNCNGTGGGYLLFGPSTIQNGSTATDLIWANQQGAGGILDLQSAGTSKFSIGNDGLTTIASGVQIGNTTSAIGGTIRWTGTDFEGYDGLQWVSLTTTSGSGGASVGKTVIKSANEIQNNVINPTATLQDDDELMFPIAANESWAFRFVVQANVGATPDIKFAVTAPSGATCTVSLIDTEAAVSNANLGCGVSTGLVTGNNTDDTYEIVGSVANSTTAGNVTLQWAQNSANATSITVYSGSYVFATANGTASTTFEQGGNAFGATAILGTTDNNGLNIITNGVTAASFSVTGDTTLSGNLGLTSGNITGVGTNITATAGLTIASGGGSNLSLDSASGTIILLDDIIQRQSSSLSYDIFSAIQDTDFIITNSGAGFEANLIVEGAVTATNYLGNGSGLTALDGSAISSGTLNDARLSTNVVLLNNNQTFTGRPTFSDGLILGNSSSTSAGAIRWSGSDFEGYDGVSWVSLTSGGGGGGGGVGIVASSVKPAQENVSNSTILQDDDDLSFPIGANETWSFRFVVQATSPAAADLQFAVTAPSGATCDVAVANTENAATVANLGCGATSGLVAANLQNDLYEIVGSIRNGPTAGNVTLQWAQYVADPGNATIYGGSYYNAVPEGPSSGGGLAFTQGGNAFGASGIIGTTDSNDLNFITAGTTAFSLTATGESIFSGEARIYGGMIIGNAASDGLTINSDSVTLNNGLNIDSNTFVIDSLNNRVGIGDASPDNPLSINTPATVDGLAQVSVYTNGAGNKGLIIQGAISQSENLLEIQDDTGSSLASFNSSGQLVLGVQSSANGRVIFNNNTNMNTITLIAGVATTSRSILLPDEDGTVCLSNSDNCGFIRIAPGVLQTDITTNDTIAINKTGASGNLITLQRSGVAAFTVSNNGALQIRTTSTTGLDIQDGGGVSSFSVDTFGDIVHVGLGTTDTVQVILQLDSFSTYADTAACTTTGNQGGMYYNSTTTAVRACVDGTWEDIVTTKGLGLLMFGVVPDSSNATSPGDIGGISGIGNSPCSVTRSAAQQVTVNPCVAYSGGRKVIVASTALSTASIPANNYVNVCLTGTDGQPALGAANATETNAGTPAFSVGSPVLCLATVRMTGAVGTVGNIWDVRTFTTSTKQFTTINSVNTVGMMVVGNGTNANRTTTTGTASAGDVKGVVVATTRTASTTAINAIVTTDGHQYVKMVVGSAPTVGSVVQTTTTTGYARTSTTFTRNYANLGTLQKGIDTVCNAATNCQYSGLVDLGISR